MKLVLGQIPGQKKYLLNCIPAPTPDHAARLRRLRLAHVLLRVQEVDLADLVLLAAGGVGNRRRGGDGGQLGRGARMRIFGVLGDELLLCLTTAVAHGRGDDREGN